MSGKGSDPRPLSVTPEQFAERFDAIDWGARERERHLRGPRGRKPSDLTFGEPRELDMRPIAGDDPVEYPQPGTPIWSKP